MSARAQQHALRVVQQRGLRQRLRQHGAQPAHHFDFGRRELVERSENPAARRERVARGQRLVAHRPDPLGQRRVVVLDVVEQPERAGARRNEVDHETRDRSMVDPAIVD